MLCCAPALQVLAFLRVSAQQALAAFRSHSASSIAGLPDTEQQAYAVRFMREYLSQAWFDKLASSYNISQQSLSEYCTVLSGCMLTGVAVLYCWGHPCEAPALECLSTAMLLDPLSPLASHLPTAQSCFALHQVPFK